MKHLITSIAVGLLLLLVPSARAQTRVQVIDDTLREAIAQRDDLVAAQVEAREAKAGAALALAESDKRDAAHQAEVDKLKATIAEKDELLGRWYVRAVLFAARCIFWLSIGGGVAVALVYGVALVGGFCSPGTLVFRVAQMFIKVFPLMNFVDNWHPTTTVRMKEVPVVDGSAVVATPAPKPTPTPGLHFTTLHDLIASARGGGGR